VRSVKKERQNVRSVPTNTAARPSALKRRVFCPDPNRSGSRTIACSVDAIRPSIELEGRSQAEADVVVAVVRRVVVAIRGAAILRVVVPRAATVHAVRALWRLTLKSQKYNFLEFFCIGMFHES